MDREILGADDIIKQHRMLRWYSHISRKNEHSKVKCMDYKVEGVRHGSKPKKSWKEVAKKDGWT